MHGNRRKATACEAEPFLDANASRQQVSAIHPSKHALHANTRESNAYVDVQCLGNHTRRHKYKPDIKPWIFNI